MRLPSFALLPSTCPTQHPRCCFETSDLGSSCVSSQVISRSLGAAVGLVLGCLLACPESWLRRLCVVGFRVILAILGAPDPCLKTTVVTVMSTELPVDTVSADDQLDALIAEHRLREQNSGTLDGSTLGTASVAQLASPCSVPRALAPPLPSGQNCLQLAPAAAQLIAGEMSLNPLGVLASACAPCSAPLPALPCPTVAASPNMSVFVQPSLGDLSVLSSAYPAPSTVAGSPLPLLDQGASDQHGVPSGCVAPCTVNQLALVDDSGGAVTPVAGSHVNVERFTLSPQALPVAGCNLGSVESRRMLEASELDRVKYVVEMLRSENVAIKEVLEEVVASTRSELLSINGRLGNGLGQLRAIIGNMDHDDFNTMKREIDRLCAHAETIGPKFAEIDRTIQAIYMRCEVAELDTVKKFEECRADYVEKLRGLNENFASRIVELENYMQSQSAAYREQFISIERRFGRIEAKLAGVGVAPSVDAPMMPLPQNAVFHPPPVSQQFAQQAVSVPVPVSDGQSFRSYMSWDQRQVEDRQSTSSGRTHRTLERQRPIIPRETGMLRRTVDEHVADAASSSGSRQHHESVMPRERSALKSSPVPSMFNAAPVEPVSVRSERMADPLAAPCNSRQLPRVCRLLPRLPRGTATLIMAIRMEPVAAQVVPPAHPVEQRGINPSPKACVQYARTVPGWPVEPRPQPGFAEDLSFPQRIQFDERSVPCSGKNNRWVDAMLALLRLDMLLRVQLEL